MARAFARRELLEEVRERRQRIPSARRIATLDRDRARDREEIAVRGEDRHSGPQHRAVRTDARSLPVCLSSTRQKLVAAVVTARPQPA